MTDFFQKQIVQRITKNLLDIQILRLIEAEPMWGYKIKKQAEVKFGVTLRHGVLYPLLNMLEQEGFATSQSQRQGGRTRKVYKLTRKGHTYLQAYEEVLQTQIRKQDIE